MRILYKQSASAYGADLLQRYGIEQCYLKEIPEVDDARFVTKKEHSHAGYEIHMIAEGEQRYAIGDAVYTVSAGDLLIIPMGVRHRVLSSCKSTFKFSLVFSLKANTDSLFLQLPTEPRQLKDASESIDICRRISRGGNRPGELSSLLSSLAVLELAAGLLKQTGFVEEGYPCEKNDKSDVLELAKKYINDNVEQNPSVPDVASYCYMGEKQLTRIFSKHEGISPGAYIRRARARRIEQLLSDTALSIKEISRMMSFDNEYYFNAFFKKNYGMPPGEYRKTLSQN